MFITVGQILFTLLELLVLALIIYVPISLYKGKHPEASSQPEYTYTRCPTCGDRARVYGDTWECEFCGDCGRISQNRL